MRVRQSHLRAGQRLRRVRQETLGRRRQAVADEWSGARCDAGTTDRRQGRAEG